MTYYSEEIEREPDVERYSRTRSRDRDRRSDHSRSRSNSRNYVHQNRTQEINCGYNENRTKNNREYWDTQYNYENGRSRRKEDDCYYNKYDGKLRDRNHHYSNDVSSNKNW